MMDLRLYSSDEETAKGTNSEKLSKAGASSPTAFGIEVLANKVVKFLLTRIGSDLLEPEYGGTALHHGQLSSGYLPKFKMEMLDDIARCRQYISAGEATLPSTDITLTEPLAGINLDDVVYDSKTGDVGVYLTIKSTSGKKAVVGVNSRTDS